MMNENCDVCKRYIERKQERFHMFLNSDKFWDGVEMDYIEKRITLCPICAGDIKNSLLILSNILKPPEQESGDAV